MSPFLVLTIAPPIVSIGSPNWNLISSIWKVEDESSWLLNLFVSASFNWIIKSLPPISSTASLIILVNESSYSSLPEEAISFKSSVALSKAASITSF